MSLVRDRTSIHFARCIHACMARKPANDKQCSSLVVPCMPASSCRHMPHISYVIAAQILLMHAVAGLLANAGRLRLRHGRHGGLSDHRCGKSAIHPELPCLIQICTAIHCQLTGATSPGQPSHLSASGGDPSSAAAAVTGTTAFTPVPTPSAASQLPSPFQRAAAEAATAHGLVRFCSTSADDRCLSCASWHDVAMQRSHDVADLSQHLQMAYRWCRRCPSQ